MRAALVTIPLACAALAPATAQEVAGRLLVDLDAADPSAGSGTWENRGALGDFQRRGKPQRLQRDGVWVVDLAGGDGYEGPASVKEVEGNADRTIEVWAWNPGAAVQETLVAWGRRGSGDRRNLALGCGNDPAQGAAVHGAGDLGWSTVLDERAWSHLVYTFDGDEARVYYNGSAMSTRALELDTLPGQPMRIGGQNGPEGQWQVPATLSIARVRVHSEALTPAEVAANFAHEAQAFGARPWEELRKTRLDDPLLLERINEAIDRGASALIEQQELDGSWRQRVHDYGSGMTGLAVYTLLKCAVPESHPAVQRGVAFIERYPPTRTYSAGCALMALGALRGGGHDELLRDIADELVDWQKRGGGWAYPQGNVDLSCTQFAVLGLRAAAARGARVPSRVWTSVADYVLDGQERPRRGVTGAGGARAQGYVYHVGKGATGSMTAAGLSVLAIASQHVARVPKSWASSIERGLAWFDVYFSVTSNPYPGSANGHENARLHYYLYGLERVGSLLNREEIGGQHWYAEGALALLRSQNDQGTWGNQSNTCFALLFLTRATADQPMTGREPGSARLGGRFGSDDPAAEVSLRAAGERRLTIWISSFGDEVRARLGGTPQVERVEYFLVDGDARELLEAVAADPEGPSLDVRFAVQHELEPGEYRLVAHVVARGPDGAPVELESAPLAVKVDRARAAELMEYARDGARNLLTGIEVDAAASTERDGQHGAAKVADGLAATGWAPKPEDAEPWLRLELRRAVRADSIVLTPTLPEGKKAGDAPATLLRASVLVNGTPHELALDPSAWRKSTIALGRTLAVRTVEVRVLEVAEGKTAGLAELELRRAE